MKAVVFDFEGNEVCLSEAAVQLRRPDRSWFEQDMNELWETVKTCLEGVVRKLRESQKELAGIGITSTDDGI